MIKINLLPSGVRPSSARSMTVFPWKKIRAPLGAVVGLYSVWLLGAWHIQSGMLARLTAEAENLKTEKIRAEKVEAALRALQNQAAVIQTLKIPQAQWAPRLNLLSDSLVGQLWFSSLTYEPDVPPEGKADSSKNGVSTGESAVKKAPPPESAKSVGKKEDPMKKQAGKQPAAEKWASSEMSVLVLRGSAFVTADEQSSPVSRFLQRLRENPEFKRRFRGLDLKSVEHRQINGQEISDFVIALYPATR